MIVYAQNDFLKDFVAFNFYQERDFEEKAVAV